MKVASEKYFFTSKPFSKKNGFTLLEILLVTGLIGVLAAIAAPMFLSLQAENDINITAVNLSDVLRQAQLRAQAVNGDSAWGVEISTSSAVIFKGNNFSVRDQNFDENFLFNENITASGTAEIIFAPLTGWPQNIGTIYLQHTDGRSTQIDINAKGILDLP